MIEEVIGKSIILRKYTMADAQFIFLWRNETETTVYMGRKFRTPRTIEQVKDSLQNIISSNSKESMYYAIAMKGTREYAGGIDLTSIDPIDKTCILSIVIGKNENRNQGIASEAINLILDIAFNKLQLHKVELNVFEKNMAAIRCYTKNGFTIEGNKREHMLINGKYENLLQMGILDAEYKLMKKEDA